MSVNANWVVQRLITLNDDYIRLMGDLRAEGAAADETRYRFAQVYEEFRTAIRNGLGLVPCKRGASVQGLDTFLESMRDMLEFLSATDQQSESQPLVADAIAELERMTALIDPRPDAAEREGGEQ